MLSRRSFFCSIEDHIRPLQWSSMGWLSVHSVPFVCSCFSFPLFTFWKIIYIRARDNGSSFHRIFLLISISLYSFCVFFFVLFSKVSTLSTEKWRLKRICKWKTFYQCANSFCFFQLFSIHILFFPKDTFLHLCHILHWLQFHCLFSSLRSVHEILYEGAWEIHREANSSIYSCVCRAETRAASGFTRFWVIKCVSRKINFPANLSGMKHRAKINKEYSNMPRWTFTIILWNLFWCFCTSFFKPLCYLYTK